MAQTTTGTISGVVTAPGGQPQPGARIVLTRVETGNERTSTSSAQGGFIFALLPAAEYRLAISTSGQLAFDQRIHLLVNQEVRIDAVLVPQRRDVTEVTAVRGS